MNYPVGGAIRFGGNSPIEKLYSKSAVQNNENTVGIYDSGC